MLWIVRAAIIGKYPTKALEEKGIVPYIEGYSF
jgi:hypothetical protein